MSVRRENQSKNTVSVLIRHTKNRLVRYGHFIFQVNWIEMVFIIEENMKKMKLE